MGDSQCWEKEEGLDLEMSETQSWQQVVSNCKEFILRCCVICICLDRSTSKLSRKPVLSLEAPDSLMEPTKKDLYVALIAPEDGGELLHTSVLVFLIPEKPPLSLQISKKRFLGHAMGL